MSAQSLSRPAHAIRHFPGLIQQFLARAAQRRSLRRLAMLDDHLLSDIGISRSQALAAAAKPAWDAPDHWHQ